MTCVYLDVSGLPAPEPLEVTLEAIAELGEGDYIHFHHRQYPRLLFEQLRRAGFKYKVRRSNKKCCEVFIWKKGDEPAGSAAMDVAAEFFPWVEGET